MLFEVGVIGGIPLSAERAVFLHRISEAMLANPKIVVIFHIHYIPVRKDSQY